MRAEPPSSPRPTVIELTSKRWKAWQLLGHVLAWPATAAFLLSLANDLFWTAVAAAAVMIAAVLVLAYARVMAWWHHA